MPSKFKELIQSIQEELTAPGANPQTTTDKTSSDPTSSDPAVRAAEKQLGTAIIAAKQKEIQSIRTNISKP